METKEIKNTENVENVENVENINTNTNTTNTDTNTTQESLWRTLNTTPEELAKSSAKYDERAESGQKITFEKKEQKKANGDAKNVDKDGYLPGVFWSGYVVTNDGTKHPFTRQDANGLARMFKDVCTWKRAERPTGLSTGKADRTAEQRFADASAAIEEARKKPSEKSVTAILWQLLDAAHIITIEEDGTETRTPAADVLRQRVINIMAEADEEARRKAENKETATAKAKRERDEAKAEAERMKEGMKAAFDTMAAMKGATKAQLHKAFDSFGFTEDIDALQIKEK